MRTDQSACLTRLRLEALCQIFWGSFSRYEKSLAEGYLFDSIRLSRICYLTVCSNRLLLLLSYAGVESSIGCRMLCTLACFVSIDAFGIYDWVALCLSIAKCKSTY